MKNLGHYKDVVLLWDKRKEPKLVVDKKIDSFVEGCLQDESSVFKLLCIDESVWPLPHSET